MSSEQPKVVKIGLAGLGTVGGGVFANLEKNGDLLAERIGARLEVARVAVRDPSKARDIPIDSKLISGSWEDLVNDPEIEIIVELIGGTTEAFTLVDAALRAKKIVVTGNKALLAEHGLELFALAEQENVPLYCEAAVAGGIPIIKAIGEALVGNEIESIYGIINGTSNYILTRMADEGMSYERALAAAQELGYAEADPAFDVNGWDAAHKAIVLAWLSYGHWLKPEEISVTGIEEVDLEDISFANSLGYELKLMGVVKKDPDGRIEVRVDPSLVSHAHILASVHGVNNALAVRGDIVGETLFYGSGAGRDATSSSVIADLADAAGNLATGAGFEGFLPRGEYGTAVPPRETISQYYIRLEVDDQPGVIAQISKILADKEIGILSVVQPGVEEEDANARLVMMIHYAPLGLVEDAMVEIAALDCVQQLPVMHRVEAP